MSTNEGPVPKFDTEFCQRAGKVFGRGDAIQVVGEDWPAFLKRNRARFMVTKPERMTRDEIRAWVSERIDAVEHMRSALNEEIADALSQRVDAFAAKGAGADALNALRLTYTEASDRVVAMVIDPFVASLSEIVKAEAS